MKNLFDYTLTYITAACMAFISFGCNNNAGLKNDTKDSANSFATKKSIPQKPPGSFADTLIINAEAAVFFQPDSLQLLLIKAITDSIVFDGTMHAYFYQMRNARIVIKKNWPHAQIIESAKYRYLLFIKKDKTSDCINLDTKHDSHGLFLFDAIQSPELVDMTNVESAAGFYFANR